MLLTYWNTASFLVLYAGARELGARLTARPGRPPTARAGPVGARPSCTRWSARSTRRWTASTPQRPAGCWPTFVDDLSNWYVRRSRRRFWAGDPAALATLYECLEHADAAAGADRAVHHRAGLAGGRLCRRRRRRSRCTWRLAVADAALIDPALSAQMARRAALVELGRAARGRLRLRIRQPLARALRRAPAGDVLPAELLAEIGDELNVKVARAARPRRGERASTSRSRPNFRALGKRFGKRIQQVAKAIAAADAPASCVDALRETGDRDGRSTVRRSSSIPDDILITEVPRGRLGGGVAARRDHRAGPEDHPGTGGRASPATSSGIVQQARRDADFDVSDRITVTMAAPEEVAAAISAHQKLIAHETLALTLTVVDALSEGFSGAVGDGHEIVVHVVRA